MAFVHHQPRQQRRDRQQDYQDDTTRTSYPATSNRPNIHSTAQDWSIVFPGRVREEPTSSVSQQLTELHQSSITTSSYRSATEDEEDASDNDDGMLPGDDLALTLPPLHDGTGRFSTFLREPSSAGFASTQSGGETGIISPGGVISPSPGSEVFPESIFSGTESQADADEELGFGSGSDFDDFESDAVASSIPSHSSLRRSQRRSQRRPSRIGAVSLGSEDDENDHAQPTEASMVSIRNSAADSRSWSFLGRSTSRHLSRVPESPDVSTQLYSSARSSRFTAAAPTNGKMAELQAPAVFTSDSETDDEAAAAAATAAARKERGAFEADLAASNLAQSAGLSRSNLDGAHLRRPKRRHRRSAAGRSSKRSNTSQSLLSVDHEGRRVFGSRSEQLDGRYARDGDATPRSTKATAARGSSSLATASVGRSNSTKTTRMIGSILRRVFDLEPEVLDSFINDDARYKALVSQQPQHNAGSCARLGFAFEQPDAAVVSAPLGTDVGAAMMLDGRDEEDTLDASPLATFYENEDEEDEATVATAAAKEAEDHRAAAMLSTSPLFDNNRPVLGEDRDALGGTGVKLTEAALLQRRSASTRARPHSLMEPTTMEALSAFMNSVVMPVPMPFRLLGALFGWSGIWSSAPSHDSLSQGKDASRQDETRPGEEEAEEEEDETARREAEEERRYRYERLLSAQQAKAWSRRYRGILFANVDEDEQSLDVPELWRGEEHPAIAGESYR